MTPAAYMEAARVPPTLEPQSFGLWTISRVRAADMTTWAPWIGWDSMTLLHRATEATLHQPPGEVVMEDSRRELARHLPIWLAARGTVLVTGLGLGCVVRGLLANPRVEHIDVVEVDPGIFDVVGREFEGNPRVTLFLGDALTAPLARSARWDFAWHDIWCEGSGLQVLHAELLVRYRDRARRQGAWMFPRFAKRRMRGMLG